MSTTCFVGAGDKNVLLDEEEEELELQVCWTSPISMMTGKGGPKNEFSWGAVADAPGVATFVCMLLAYAVPATIDQ